VRLVAETWNSATSTCIALELPPVAVVRLPAAHLAIKSSTCHHLHPKGFGLVTVDPHFAGAYTQQRCP
jgi:hypothetical protein